MRSTADAALMMMVRPSSWRSTRSYETLVNDVEDEEGKTRSSTSTSRRRRRGTARQEVTKLTVAHHRAPRPIIVEKGGGAVSSTPCCVPSPRYAATSTPKSLPVVATTTNDRWNHRDELDLFTLRRPAAVTTTATTAEDCVVKPHGGGPITGATSSTVFWPLFDKSFSSSEDDEDDDDEKMIYANKYCEQKKNGRARHHYHQRRMVHWRNQQQKPQQQRKVLNSSFCSFDTSQTEEETSTYSSYEETKAVQWQDYANAGDLETRHSYDASETHTCRIVILLLLNNGGECSPDNNFEFLHCEFTVHDKLKVSDVLLQISLLVNAAERPFTALFHQGLEMINALAIQDFDLCDGQSILIATRSGEQSISTVLKQANVLLRDKMLLAELRKARIAGRSLQMLYSSKGISGDGKSSLMATTTPHNNVAIQSNPSLELASVGSFRDVSTEVCDCD